MTLIQSKNSSHPTQLPCQQSFPHSQLSLSTLLTSSLAWSTLLDMDTLTPSLDSVPGNPA